MPRPRLRRHVCVRPRARYFKPRGIPLRHLDPIALTHEEMEALWLADYRGKEQIDAARHMKTSQSTFQRMLVSARHKVSRALVEGRALGIE